MLHKTQQLKVLCSSPNNKLDEYIYMAYLWICLYIFKDIYYIHEDYTHIITQQILNSLFSSLHDTFTKVDVVSG